MEQKSNDFLEKQPVSALMRRYAMAMILFESIPLVFVRMFGSDGGTLYTQFVVYCLRVYLSLVIFTCLQKACAMFLQSIGHAKSAVPLSVLRDVLLIVLSLILPTRMGVIGVLWAAPMADIIAIVITAIIIARVWKQMGSGAKTSPPRILTSTN